MSNCFRRFVSAGDVFGVLLPSRTQLPQPSLSAATATAAVLQRYEVVYFQVQAVSPVSPEPLAVNPTVTQLVLQGGSARVLLPVGFKRYAVTAAAARAAQQPTISSSSTAVQTGQDDAASGAGVAASTKQQQQQQQQQQQPLLLGVHASAAYQHAPGLPGVPGPLTDNWRHVGTLLAPLLHPSSAAVELSCSLLLWGPRGSGRRTAARAAAAALGMHVIEWSCHDLKVRLMLVLMCYNRCFDLRQMCYVAWGGISPFALWVLRLRGRHMSNCNILCVSHLHACGPRKLNIT
jgi:hypothetical protein